MATCSAPATIDTSQAGAGTFTVTATDYAGNTTTQSVTYTVDPATTTTTTTTSTSTQTQPPPARSLAPALSGSPALSAAGVVTLHLQCRGTSRCAGLAELSIPGQTEPTSSAHYSIAAGHTASLRLVLNSAARRLHKLNRNRLTATLELVPSGANAVTSQHRLTLAITATRH